MTIIKEVMDMLKVRYIYSPNCPESFGTLSRLNSAFKNHKTITFEVFNTVDFSDWNSVDWFPEELNYVNTITGTSGDVLLYSKLFVNGKAIKGFPPSPKLLREEIYKIDPNWDSTKYSSRYKTTVKDKFPIIPENIEYTKISRENSIDLCKLCTKFNPYLNTDDYVENEWIPFERKKVNYLNLQLDRDQLFGYIAYYNSDPIGFIEGYPASEVGKLGFPSLCKNSVMITCLSIRSEYHGNKISKGLLNRFEKIVSETKYDSIQIIAFPDEHNWHPVSMYKKFNYIEESQIDGLYLLYKDIK